MPTGVHWRLSDWQRSRVTQSSSMAPLFKANWRVQKWRGYGMVCAAKRQIHSKCRAASVTRRLCPNNYSIYSNWYKYRNIHHTTVILPLFSYAIIIHIENKSVCIAIQQHARNVFAARTLHNKSFNAATLA